MPLHKVISLSPNTKLYLWKITEDIGFFLENVKLKDSSLQRIEGMKSEEHKKGFLAVRMLLQHNDYTDFDLYYDEFGKPHLKEGSKKQEAPSNFHRTSYLYFAFA
ncbi:hypothetical protein [Flavobacterium sp.]|uniref:hypothetical protein n=1 Tax=Flavobacterium sp. TaxID=239 RepID=UPI0025D23EE7|nr:hypothetical protein [Flavobacterium sp.]